MMKIYTRTGDEGTTSLFSGTRAPKDELIFDTLGALDEANSTIGLAIALLPSCPPLNALRIEFEDVQNALFDLGAAVAMPRTSHQPAKLAKTRFDDSAVEKLEKWIDRIGEHLPTIHTFILPGGHPAGASLHLARGIIRRAERLIVPLFRKGEVEQGALVYLNRLSDYLFMAARFINQTSGIKETNWQPMPHASH